MNDLKILKLMEKAPPGREPQVRALKRAKGVDNPYAVAWVSNNKSKAKAKRKNRGETNSSGGLPQTMRDGATDWGRTAKDVEGGPGSGRHPYGGHQRTANKILKKMDKILKKRGSGLKGGDVQPRLKDLNRRLHVLWGSPAYHGARQADATVLKSLLKESIQSRTYRFSESALMEVVAPVVPASKEAAVPEGPRVTCWLITEGLGNRADMHYYGPECIQAGAPLFEGQPCFVDHQKRSESQDQPERTVRDKCGYFRNVEVARDENGRLGLKAELHYDLSETGKYAYDKACTAIHYKQEFPGSDKEYVGLSIAADGKLEEKTMMVGDEVLDVKYVTEFTAVGSVDEVTSPARGGRFTAVLDS